MRRSSVNIEFQWPIEHNTKVEHNKSDLTMEMSLELSVEVLIFEEVDGIKHFLLQIGGSFTI